MAFRFKCTLLLISSKYNIYNSGYVRSFSIVDNHNQQWFYL